MTINTENRRGRPVVTYLTTSEDEAVKKLGTDYAYEGKADAIRHAIALLIHQMHPELGKMLRSDLQTLDK